MCATTLGVGGGYEQISTVYLRVFAKASTKTWRGVPVKEDCSVRCSCTELKGLMYSYLLHGQRRADLLSSEDHGALGQHLRELEGVQAQQLADVTDHLKKNMQKKHISRSRAERRRCRRL